VFGRIYLNHNLIYEHFVAGTDGTGLDYSVTTTLSAGDILDFAVAPNGGDAFDSTMFSSSILTISFAAPSVNAGGTVNGGSFASSLAAAGIASAFGTNFTIGNNFATAVPLPTTLGGVSVKLNNTAAPLFFVGPNQVNFQIPWELLGQTQTSLTITNPGGISATQTINLSPAAPGVFTVDSSGKGQGAAQISNTAIFAAPANSIPGASARPAQRGEFITIYCSGLGAVQSPPASGAAASGQPTLALPTMTIGGVAVTPSFAGLAPGFVGLYQINAQVPQSVTPGNAVAIVITAGGVTSNTVTIAVQ
jgi:uncharacterized protein (TIGR03437 family)